MLMFVKIHGTKSITIIYCKKKDVVCELEQGIGFDKVIALLGYIFKNLYFFIEMI